ncbi:MAG: triose-phosphate isomerase [Pseudomonadota bacterium]
MPRTLIAGNWKMNGLRANLSEVDAIVGALAGAHQDADIALCGPATLIAQMAERAHGSRLQIGGQTCHHAENGAHTGDISAPMIRDAGATYVIVGHSERREAHAERSTYVQEQAYAALDAGLIPIICIGENYNERQRGETDRVNERVLRKSMPYPTDGREIVDFVVAYEPKWAIGTGQTPTMEEIESAHGHIRDILVENQGGNGGEIQILYGGSMKPGNARDILAIENVNGGLIGGASLKADDFLAIYAAAAS